MSAKRTLCEHCFLHARTTPACATYEGHPICFLCLHEACLHWPSIAQRVLQLIREDPAFVAGTEPLCEIVPPEELTERAN